MQIVQFSPAVYWTRVVIFLLPFLHTISENNEHSFFESTNMYIFSQSPDLCGNEQAVQKAVEDGQSFTLMILMHNQLTF